MKIDTTADVHDLLGAAVDAAALAAALELGLVGMFEEGPRPVHAVAEAFDIPETRCRYWLAALAALGVLEEAGDGYGLSAVGRAAILEGQSREAWRYLAVEARESSPLAVDLARRLGVRGPVTDDPAAVTDYMDKLRVDPDRARRFTELLYELHEWLADAVAETVDLREARRLLDLGGGSGVVSFALLRRNPDLTATVLDIPAVCEAGRAIADRTDVAARIAYVPVDYSDQPLPEGFDAIMTCDARFTCPLLGKIAQALPSGGRYLLVDRSFDTGPSQRTALARGLFAASLVDPDHAFPTIEQVYADIRAAGLEPTPYVELAARPLWKVIEARK
ncbi:MAG TPA: methyltransferase [Actinomycetota bacterium]